MTESSDEVDLDDLPDGVLVAGDDATVTAANRVAAAMLGGSVPDLVGRPLREVMSLDDLEGHSWYECTRPYDGFELRSRLGERVWYLAGGQQLLVTARLVRDAPAGRVRRVVVGLRDARARAWADRERSDLVATVAHELRSPLTGVKGFAATLLSRWDRFSDSQRLLMLSTIDADADRLGRLITDLLDTARIDTNRMRLRLEPLDLAATLRQVLATSEAPAASITVLGPPSLPVVWADADRVCQVITNLVENALRHGAGDVTLRRHGTAGGVEISVDDHGPGVPEEIRTRVFTRFWHTGVRGGSGLGLYIVRGIVEAHGGTVTITDAPGGGASVRVWLPRNEPAVLREAEPERDGAKRHWSVPARTS